MEFDGVDDYINLGDKANMEGIDELSISFWFNTNNNSKDQDLITKGKYYGVTASWGVKYDGSLNRIDFSISNSRFRWAGFTPNNNQWYHLTFTYSNLTDEMKIYSDGILLSGGGDQGIFITIPETTKEVKIGVGDGRHYFNGSIKQTKIYNRAINQTEITALFNSDTILNTEGLVANYPMNKTYKNYVTEIVTTTDKSGNGNNGTLEGGMQLDSNNTKNGFRGAGFDGVDDYVEINNSFIMRNDSQSSLSFWAKTKDGDSHNSLFGAFPINSYEDYIIWRSSDDISIESDVPGDSINLGTSGFLPQDGEWKYLTIIRNLNNVSLYLNGEYIASNQFAQNGNININYIGSGYVSSKFNGSIDDVRIYNRSLTPTEITELYTTNSITDETGLVAYYDMEDVYTAYTPTTRNILVDTTPPTINVTAPTGTYQILYDNKTLNLNYSIADTTSGLDSCWFIYNNVTTSLNCSLNTTQFNYTKDINNLTVYSNDTFWK